MKNVRKVLQTIAGCGMLLFMIGGAGIVFVQVIALILGNGNMMISAGSLLTPCIVLSAVSSLINFFLSLVDKGSSSSLDD